LPSIKVQAAPGYSPWIGKECTEFLHTVIIADKVECN